MNVLLEAVRSVFTSTPEIALFISLCIGYLIGQINFGKFQLGGVAGSLLVAVLVSQIGVHVNDTVKNILFILFIYAVGYTSGPMFFKSLGKQSLKEIVLAATLAFSGLITVVILAKIFHLNKGLASGIAAGGLTQSAIMGTAESAIKSLNLGAATSQLVADISVGYGVTYIFGSFGTIILCTTVLEKFMKKRIHDDALKAEALSHNKTIGDGALAVPAFAGRVFNAGGSAGKTVEELEKMFSTGHITVESLKRGTTLLSVTPDLKITDGDKLLVIGRSDSMPDVEKIMGAESAPDADMDIVVLSKKVAFTNKDLSGKNLRDIMAKAHGVYILALTKGGISVEINQDTKIDQSDVLTVYGSKKDITDFSSLVGYSVTENDKTDFVILGIGLVAGILIGRVIIHAGSIPITLGSGGGALVSGLFFGWFRTKHMKIAALPNPTAQFMKDLGLAGFVAVVGLNYGMQAVVTIKEKGLTILLVGMLVTIIPVLITMFFGRYVLKYDNAAVLAGALSGSRSANPAFGEVLNKAGNAVPTVPFAITYALANVFLTLLGPLVVALV